MLEVWRICAPTASGPTSCPAAAWTSCAPTAEQVYGIPAEQVLGSTIATKYDTQDGEPVLMREPEVYFVDDGPGKPVGIDLFIGRRPLRRLRQLRRRSRDAGVDRRRRRRAAEMIVHHDDAEREYAYGPANGLPDSKVGTFPQALEDEAKQKAGS